MLQQADGRLYRQRAGGFRGLTYFNASSAQLADAFVLKTISPLTRTMT
jgi:hypothetical protein